MSELPRNHEQTEVLATEAEVGLFLVHFADRPGDDAGSKDHVRGLIAALLAAELVEGDVTTVKDKWNLAREAMLHRAYLSNLAEGVSTGRFALRKADFDTYTDALYRSREMVESDYV